MEELAAVMVMDCKTAAVTVSATPFELTPPWLAETFVEPTEFPLASPLALIVATVVFEEFQVTEVVRFCVLPSVKVPVAVN